MEKIIKLRKYFKKEKIDGYLIPKNDEFFGEYISSYNDRLNYISNYSGSYGFALILKTKNYFKTLEEIYFENYCVDKKIISTCDVVSITGWK